MAKSTTWAGQLLDLLLNNQAATGIGDAGGLLPSATDGSLYLGLHTGAVAAGDTQDSNEADYTGYARLAVARDDTQWTVTGDSATNAAELAFAQCSGGTNAITHVSLGVASTGATAVLYASALSASFAVSSGITPTFAVGSLTIQEADIA